MTACDWQAVTAALWPLWALIGCGIGEILWRIKEWREMRKYRRK